MNIKLDENLPRQLVQVLASLGHDVDTVPEEQINNKVWIAELLSDVIGDLEFVSNSLFATATGVPTNRTFNGAIGGHHLVERGHQDRSAKPPPARGPFTRNRETMGPKNRRAR